MVFFVIFSSILFASMQKVSSQSTKTILAPSSLIAPTVATKVLAAVITSSPGLIFAAFNDNFKASKDIPKAEFITNPEQGHLMHEENPELISDQIKSFYTKTVCIQIS